MNWFIDGNDEIEIYITDLWREFYIPKFRISMTVEEPYLFLYWNDRERGEGGDRRTLQIDYRDVVDGYSGYADNPSSAADLKEMIEEMIRNGFTGGGGGHDLLDKGDLLTHDGVSDVIHPAGADNTFLGYDSSTSDGLKNFTAAEIVALAGVTGTFLMPETFQDGNTTGTGANQFLDDLGYDNTTAAIAWSRVDAEYPGGIDVSTMTLDFVCWQEMFYFAQENGYSYMMTPGSGKSYYVNNTLYLPRYQDLPSNRTSLSFIINFAGARVRNSSGGDMILFDRYPADQTDADTMISYQYCFHNGVLRGDGGVTDADTIIRLGATSRSEFRNINFESAGVMVDAQFCLEPTFDNCNISDYGEYGFKIWNGQWSGAGFANAQSNIVRIDMFRSYNSPGNTPEAALYCSGNHTIYGNLLVHEGDVGPAHHFFYDNPGTLGVNPCKLNNIYMEFSGCTRAAYRFKAGKGQYIMDTFRSSVVVGDMPVLIEGDNDRDPTSSLHIILKNSQADDIDSKLRAVGDPDYPIFWYVEHVEMNDNDQLNVAANFETGVIANSYIPEKDHVQFNSKADTVTITGDGTPQRPLTVSASAMLSLIELN